MLAQNEAGEPKAEEEEKKVVKPVSGRRKATYTNDEVKENLGKKKAKPAPATDAKKADAASKVSKEMTKNKDNRVNRKREAKTKI